MRRICTLAAALLLLVSFTGCEDGTLPEAAAPAIIDEEVTSRGFYVQVSSGAEYSIQGSSDSGANWVTISSGHAATDASGEIHEFLWSSMTAFPVPEDLEVRVVTEVAATDPVTITAEIGEFTVGMGVWNSIAVYLDDYDDSSSGAAEAWVKGDFFGNTYYTIRTSIHYSYPNMAGSYIWVYDADGNLVNDSYSASTLYDDDSGDGNFSEISAFKVALAGTYYVLIRSDLVAPLTFDFSDHGWIHFDSAKPVT